MLNIDHINKGNTYNYRFPTIDFKFQNTGGATAFLWQFAISVLQVEIDVTPVLAFKSNVEQGTLQIIATNNGWGTAHNCLIQIEDEPTLTQLFTDAARRYAGTIQSGESKIILRLSKESANPEQLKVIGENFEDVNMAIGRPRRGVLIGQEIELAHGTWTCQDDKRINHTGKSYVLSPSKARIILTPNGFLEDYIENWMLAESDTTYISFIDPFQGDHEQIYPFSRKIPPGDVERFHIMIGSRESCHLLIQFKFFIDQTTILKSEAFDIKIWNPRNSLWRDEYEDGTALSRRLVELQRLANNGWNRENEIDFLQKRAAIYPFISIDKD